MDTEKKYLIILPTYNEKENIERMADTLLAVDNRLNILIIDDNSPDGTGEIANGISKKNPQVNVIHRENKSGLGTAYIKGFHYALDNNYDCILMMDSDFSHDPKYIPEFLNKLREYDLIIGSRYVPGGGIIGWPVHRKLLSRFGNIYANIVTGLPIKDWTSGFAGFRSNILKGINLDEIHSEGYAFLIELKYRIFKKNNKVHELPIVFTDRVAGKSKISRRIIWEAILLILRLGFSK